MRPLLSLFVVSLLTVGGLAGCLERAGDLVSARLEAPEVGVPLDAEGFSAALVEGYLYQTFTVTSEAGFPVHAEVYLPDPATQLPGVELPEKFPAILLASPYNGAGYGPELEFGYDPYDFLVKRLLLRGYAVVVGDSSAMGGSGGCWDFMGPSDVTSAVALVEGIAAQPWSDGKVGMMGLSYDGMTQIMASSVAAQHLVTVVPAAPLTHAYAGLYMNGVHYGGGWMATTSMYTMSGLAPPGANADRYPGYVQSLPPAPRCAAEATAYGNDPSGAYNPYYQARDFRPLAGDVTASVFYIQGFLDAAVKPDNFGDWFHGVSAPKKAWLGHWFHQYPTAQNAGRDDLYLTLHRWFDHWLKDVDNGIDQELWVDVQDSQGRWRVEPTWPPVVNASPLDLHLSPDGLSDAAPSDSGSVTFGGAASALGMATRAASTAATLDGAPLEAELHIAGMPRLNLTLASDRPGGQVVAHLYDVAEDGTTRLVSRGAFNLLLAEDLRSAEPLTPGAPVNVAFDLYPTDYLVPAGHALRLTLETTGATTWFNPDPWGSTLTLSTGGDAPATLTLPTIARSDADVFHVGCGRPLANVVEGCYDEDLKDKGVDS